MYKKLLSTFFLMVCTMIFIGSLFFYYYNYTIHKEYARTSLEQLAQDTSDQIDVQVRLLNALAIDIVTNTTFLEAANRLKNYPDDGEAKEIVQKLLIAHYINKSDVYRISLFNEEGMLVSTSPLAPGEEKVENSIREFAWYNNTHILSGRKLIVPPHQDPWNQEVIQEVIALIRPIQVGEERIGFIEVQQKVEVLHKIMDKKWNNKGVITLVLDGEKQVFYQTKEKRVEEEKLERIIQGLDWYDYQTIEREDMIISRVDSKINDWKTVILLDLEEIHQILKGLRTSIGVAGIGLTIILAGLIWACLSSITKPLGELVKKLEHFSLNNLESFEEEPVDYEIRVVHHALSEMRERINQSIEKEKALENLQTKATFEALQAQIGPHFLFNTLGSIANMCEEGESEQAADACYNLSELLRYSANYKEAIVTLREEEENLRSYLSLMQGRYRQRLSYEVVIAPECLGQDVPRLTFQPLIENGIRYSLMEHEKVCIGVYSQWEPNQLVVRIVDNGCGMTLEKRQSIDAAYQAFVQHEEHLEAKDDIRFGRMGLLGTLIRLYLYYDQRFHYEISNNREGGMCIELRIRRGENDV